MRIHSDTITRSDLFDACVNAGVRVAMTRSTEHGSRSHRRAFDVILTGSNSRRQNGGSDYAATYDEWGRFLAFLFDLDPAMKCTYYADRADFHIRTKGAYDTRVGA